jgi:hypothetical protein
MVSCGSDRPIMRRNERAINLHDPTLLNYFPNAT